MQWVINKPHIDGIGNIMKGFISAYSIHDNTKIECNPTFSLGLYDTVLNEKHIYQGGEKQLFGTCRLLVLKNEECEQENLPSDWPSIDGCNNPNLEGLFSTKVAIDWNYNPMRISEKIQTRIKNTIDRIEFLPIIYDLVRQYTDQIIPETTLGISVRTWKASHEANIHRAYNPDVYKDIIRKNISNCTHVLLSVDNAEYVNEYIEFLGQFPVSVVLFRQGENENYTQHSFVKALALSKCTKCIVSRNSTFSELIFWFSHCKTEIVPLF